MSLDQNILVKLNKAGFSVNDKWLVKDVSLQVEKGKIVTLIGCLLYTSPSPRDLSTSRMPSSA